VSISTSNRVKEKSNREESKLFCSNVAALAETAKRRAAAGAQRRRCCRCRNDAFSVTAAVETFIGVRSSCCCCCCVADAGNNSSAVEITEARITKVQSTSYRSAISVNLAGQSKACICDVSCLQNRYTFRECNKNSAVADAAAQCCTLRIFAVECQVPDFNTPFPQ